jgi:signal transduction histidine kinase/tetratricopeptide (TPR) repeat protein
MVTAKISDGYHRIFNASLQLKLKVYRLIVLLHRKAPQVFLVEMIFFSYTPIPSKTNLLLKALLPRVCLPVLMLGLHISVCSNAGLAQIPPNLGQYFTADLQRATDYMNSSRYDSAQRVIMGIFRQSAYPLNNLELYYLHSYEAEIMYYNALFEQGLNTSLRALEIAGQIKNDTITGNAENLVGLFLMSLSRNEEAIPYFRKSIDHIPDAQKNGWLAMRYQAFGNLAECFLKLQLSDSANYYANKSLEGAVENKRVRGMAIAHWTMAESSLLRSDFGGAIEHSKMSYALVKDEPHRDVLQSACDAFMKVYLKTGMCDSAIHWMDIGLVENSDTRNTDFSRLWFLQQAIDCCIQCNQPIRGNELLAKLNHLQQQVNLGQQEQRISILKDFYEKNQKLLLADERNKAQQSEITLRGIITTVVSLLALLLVVAIILAFRFFRQRQRIQQLEHFQQMKIQERELEVKSIESRLKAVEIERNRIASDLHDDIGAALSSIRIYSAALERKFDENPLEAKSLNQRITDASKGMMERMSDIVWSIHPKNDGAESLLLRMKSYASEILGSNDISLTYAIGKETEHLQFNMQARKNLYLIFKEAINNISKYSKASVVNVEFYIQNEFLIFNINDNGVGFNVMQASAGHGLRSMSQRLELLKGNLHIISHHNEGTKLECKIPLKCILVGEVI